MKNELFVPLLEDIFGKFGERERKKVRENPEVYALSLLTVIKKELPAVSETLQHAVLAATYDINLQQAQERIDKVNQHVG